MECAGCKCRWYQRHGGCVNSLCVWRRQWSEGGWGSTCQDLNLCRKALILVRFLCRHHVDTLNWRCAQLFAQAESNWLIRFGEISTTHIKQKATNNEALLWADRSQSENACLEQNSLHLSVQCKALWPLQTKRDPLPFLLLHHPPVIRHFIPCLHCWANNDTLRRTEIEPPVQTSSQGVRLFSERPRSLLPFSPSLFFLHVLVDR